MLDTHYRIIGYVCTLAMHIGNSIGSRMTFKEEVLQDPNVRAMKSMEDSYFTVWNIVFQVAYTTFSLYCDVNTLRSGQKTRKKWAIYLRYRKTFFCAILWPSTLFVFTAFWPLFMYDRSIIFPLYVDKVLSFYSNLIIHAGIVPVVLWELVFLPVEEPKSHVKNVAIMNSVFAVYLSWIFYMNTIRKRWPYPILGMLEGTVYFPLFFIIAYMLMTVHYFLQWYLRKCILGKQNTVSQGKTKRH